MEKNSAILIDTNTGNEHLRKKVKIYQQKKLLFPKCARRRHPPASPFTTGVSGRAAPAARVAALARSTRARARARARAKYKKISDVNQLE